MSDLAIHVEGLGKEYALGAVQHHNTLRDKIAATVRAPLRLLGGKHSRPAPSRFWALQDVSFKVRRGEIVGVMGRNGAGKSTLLKILSRITDPTTGFAAIHGRVGSLLEVGTGFHPELTGRENVFLNGAILGMRRSEIERNFDEIVAFAEVSKFIDTAVKHYSSGMYLRLAFAVAAHLEPEIMLVDEVLAVGDVAFQRKCLGKMSDVAQQGRTVLLVSHNLAAIAGLTQRSLIFASGKLSADGDTATLIQTYMAESSMGAAVGELDSTHLTVHKTSLERSATTPADEGFVVPFGEPLVCRFDLTVKEPLDRAAFFVRVTDLRDTIVYTGMSYDDGEWMSLTPGRIELRHEVMLPLAPDGYIVSMGLVDQTRRPVCKFDRLLTFQVNYPDWPFDNRPGVIVARGRWSIDA